MNLFDSDNLDRGTYDDLGQQHYHESLDWSNNIFGESIPGEEDTNTTDDTATDGAMGGAADDSMAAAGDDDTTSEEEADDTAAEM
jgi:hypothetical protein